MADSIRDSIRIDIDAASWAGGCGASPSFSLEPSTSWRHGQKGCRLNRPVRYYLGQKIINVDTVSIEGMGGKGKRRNWRILIFIVWDEF